MSKLTAQQRYDQRIANAKMKLEERDFHGLADEAMDLRELVAAHPELRRHEESLWSRKGGERAYARALRRKR